MTEVVPVELELPPPVQPESSVQQTAKQDALTVRLPWKRPDLRIALVSKFSPAREGGVVEYFNNLAKSISNLCPTVGIANLDADPPVREPNSRLSVLRVWRLNSFFYPFRIVQACLDQKSEVVHVNHEYMIYGKPFYGAFLPLMLLLFKIARRPTVLTVHSVVPRTSVWNGFFRRYSSQRLAPLKAVCFLAWTKLTLRLARHIIVHSQASKKILSEEYGYPPHRISVIGHGVESAIATNWSGAKEILGFGGRKVVLSLGFIHEKKGIEYLIRAMGHVSKSHPDSLLVIAGGPHASRATRPNEFYDYIAKLSDAVKEAEVEENVVLRAEYLPVDLVNLYFSCADVVALPYVEQFGTSGILARAMAAGKAVVATRVNPFYEIIENGVNGLLVDPANPAQLSNAIVQLLDSRLMRDSLGTNLKNCARDLCWSDVAKTHVEIYSMIAARPSKV